MSPGRLRLALLIFISWIVLTSVLLFYLGNRHYGTFSPELHWYTAAIDTQALGITPAAGFQLVHVFADGCACNRRARAHLQQLTQDGTLTAAQQYVVNLQQLVAAGFTLPATPAVLIFSSGKLLYAGPYASGPNCAVEDSLIAPILKKKLILPGLWLNGNVNTCRCAQSLLEM